METGNSPETVLDRLDGLPSRAELVAAMIERAVLRGELKAGDRLVEREVAEKLGVSKTPVREALKVLARKGVLTSHPYRGTQVRSIDAREARHLYEVRLLLEPEAVRLATPAHDRDTLRNCELTLIDSERLAHDEDLAELSLANRRFHSSLYAPGTNELLRSVLDDIQDQVAMVSVSTWRRRSTWGVEAVEHRAIFEAVAGRDGDLAAKLLHAHIGKFLARVVKNALGEAITKEERG
jgi:DNA-binding GntR family transcriptional regulator